MTPRVELISEKKLVGKRMVMSYGDYRMGELWSSFMPRRMEIKNNLSNDLISFVVYSSNHFEDFKATNEFERWAAVEVADFKDVPKEMETYLLQKGLYAVFLYKGLPSGISSFHQTIFNDWLPASGYKVDQRPHFEVLGEKYKNNDLLSEEEIWIPIKPK